MAYMTTIQELSKKTVMELKSYAKKNNIDLFGVSTKLEILEVIGSFIPPEPKQKSGKESNPDEKVAVFSTKNLHWTGVGTLEVGYNIVSRPDSEKWITHKAVRVATPEEVARAYGK